MKREDVKIGMQVKLTNSYGFLQAGGTYKVLRPQVIGGACFILDHEGDKSFLAPYCENFEPVNAANTKYTIKDLAEGRVVLENTGTVDQLEEVIKAAFPNDTCILMGNAEFYFKDYSKTGEWDWSNCHEDLNLPIQCAEDFLEDMQHTEKTAPEKLIRRFPSGAVRSDSTGRPRPDWVSPYAIEAIGQHLAGNVNDFGAVNYFLGIPEEACLESLTRHYIELSEAMLVTKDGKATKEAVTALAFNATALLHTIILKEKGLYKEVYDKTELVTVEEAKKGIKFTGK